MDSTSTPSGAAPAPAPSSTPFGNPTAFGPSESSGKGKTVALICTSVLACLGLAFGGFEFYQNLQLAKGSNSGSDTTSISNLKVELKTTDGVTTTLDADRISVNSDTSTITITDSPTIVVNGILPDKGSDYSRSINSTLIFYDPSNPTAEAHELYLRVHGGELETCQIRLSRSLTDTQDCNISEKPTQVSDLLIGQVGNGMGHELVLFLKQDGSVEYIPVYKAWMEQNYNVRGTLPIEKPVIRATRIDIPGGVDTAFQLSDGTFAYLSDLINQVDVSFEQ